MQDTLENKLKQIAVVGASGKMGRGISLLVLQEIALIACKNSPSSCHLRLIDIDASSFYDLKIYLKQQLLRFAEKNINRIRELFSEDPNKISNKEIIQAFIDQAFMITNCSTSIESVAGAELIFEAAFEDISLKTHLLSEVKKHAPNSYVLTNTSSIPIGLLAMKSGIGSHLIGYHFYNPPAVQKLLEIIPSNQTSQTLLELAFQLGKRLGKIMVQSADVAGFIGNGHFAAEIVYACHLVETLKENLGFEKALEWIDVITRDYLLRPMGIFQLLDYVGLQIIEQILEIMKLEVPLIHKFRSEGLIGGQTPEGYPKNGIFHYTNGKMDGIWSFDSKNYQPLKITSSSLPLSWKKIQKNSKLLPEIFSYFKKLKLDSSLEGKYALDYLRNSKNIENSLLSKKIASSEEDIDIVLKNGFFHLYSPHEVINEGV